MAGVISGVLGCSSLFSHLSLWSVTVIIDPFGLCLSVKTEKMIIPNHSEN